MGRGRNGPIDPSQKKPKTRKDIQRGEGQWWHFGVQNLDKNSLFLSNDIVEAMKRMDPKEVANILFSKEM